jgi:lysophospholipase L1-like esterase
MREIGTSWDRDNRNTINDNFKEVNNRVVNLLLNTPQPSEVVDIRVDEEGSIHTTAKERIDSEALKRKEKDDELSTQLEKTTQELATTNNNISKNAEEILIKTSSIPKYSVFGNQLSKLKEALSNPLVQDLGIVFLGDSITWGRTLPENGVFDPRDGTLSDPRDLFISPSFVNEFKRYIGKQYANGVQPVLSNWYASPSGESIAEYTVQHILYPRDGDFFLETVGTSMSVDEVQVTSSKTGYQIRMNDGDITGNSYNSLKFNFSGDYFTLSLGCVELDATYYDLFVDGVFQGTYSTHAGVDGFVDGTSDNRRTHTFPYIRNKEIEIRSNRNGESGTRRLRIEAIIIDKKIRISNQGINGTTAPKYTSYNLSGNTTGDGEAIDVKDNFVFVQLGTNDRLISTSIPKGSNTFKVNLKTLLDKVTPISDVILMCANPATEGTSYSFTMQGVRDVVYRTAKENNIDMIDNYAIFEDVDMSVVTADGVHPNKLGHQIIARNIINCLEAS